MNKITWSIDPMHSEITFKVRHLLISSITGRFQVFHANMEHTKDDFTDARITFEAETNSITTSQEMRDTHLKSDDFFNVEKYPYIRFVSTGVKKTGTDTYEIIGDLTIRDITKPLVLKANYLGSQKDSYGNTKAGFELTGRINRRGYDLKWNVVTEAGTIIAGDEVDLTLHVQMMQVEEKAAK